jgi:hypothetical protein
VGARVADDAAHLGDQARVVQEGFRDAGGAARVAREQDVGRKELADK